MNESDLKSLVKDDVNIFQFHSENSIDIVTFVLQPKVFFLLWLTDIILISFTNTFINQP